MKVLNESNPYLISILAKLNMVILTFVNTIIISRYLEPEIFGRYSYIFNYVAILSLILSFSIGQAYPYFKKKLGEGVKQIFVNIIYLQLYFYLILMVLIYFFYSSDLVRFILFISIMTQFNSQISFISLVNNVNKKNIIGIFTSTLYTIILSIIFFTTLKNLDYILYATAINLAINSIWLIIQNKIYPTSLIIEKKHIYKILKFSIFPMLTSLLIVCNYSIDILILKFFVDYSQIGIYGIAVILAKMLWIIPDAFKDVLFNKTARNDSINDIKFGIKFNVILSGVIIISFAFIGKSFIHLAYGGDYIDAYTISLILFLGSIPMIFFKLINTLYISIGKQKFSFLILLLAVIFNVILNFLLIPHIGIVGAAVATVVSYSISGFLFLISFKKIYKLKFKDIFLIDSNEVSKIKSNMKWRSQV